MTKLTQALLCLAVLSMLVGGGAYYGSQNARLRAAAFAEGSAIVQGTIVNRRVVTNADTPTYILDLKFKAPDGVTRNSSATVRQAVYQSFRNGDPIKITYVKADPMKFYLPGDEPKPLDTSWPTFVL